ncbi:hypothetical protein C8Q70DRAFT_1075039 [Cubamyces menziesii]|nr:hypothetical protein C8Q70DRAFT_1075039 [Cubamyces menziesii]
MSALSAKRHVWVNYTLRTPSTAESGPLVVTAPNAWNPDKSQPPSSSRTLRAARHPALARYAYVQTRRRRGPPHTEGAPRDPRSKPDTAAGPLALASTREWHALYGPRRQRRDCKLSVVQCQNGEDGEGEPSKLGTRWVAFRGGASSPAKLVSWEIARAWTSGGPPRVVRTEPFSASLVPLCLFCAHCPADLPVAGDSSMIPRLGGVEKISRLDRRTSVMRVQKGISLAGLQAARCCPRKPEGLP